MELGRHLAPLRRREREAVPLPPDLDQRNVPAKGGPHREVDDIEIYGASRRTRTRCRPSRSRAASSSAVPMLGDDEHRGLLQGLRQTGERALAVRRRRRLGRRAGADPGAHADVGDGYQLAPTKLRIKWACARALANVGSFDCPRFESWRARSTARTL